MTGACRDGNIPVLRETRNRPRRIGWLIVSTVVLAIVVGGYGYIMLSEFPPDTRTTEKTLTNVSIKP